MNLVKRRKSNQKVTGKLLIFKTFSWFLKQISFPNVQVKRRLYLFLNFRDQGNLHDANSGSQKYLLTLKHEPFSNC